MNIHNRCGSIVNRGGNTLKLFSGRLFLFFFYSYCWVRHYNTYCFTFVIPPIHFFILGFLCFVYLFFFCFHKIAANFDENIVTFQSLFHSENLVDDWLYCFRRQNITTWLADMKFKYRWNRLSVKQNRLIDVKIRWLPRLWLLLLKCWRTAAFLSVCYLSD